jgi:hypothetical protein
LRRLTFKRENGFLILVYVYSYTPPLSRDTDHLNSLSVCFAKAVKLLLVVKKQVLAIYCKMDFSEEEFVVNTRNLVTKKALRVVNNAKIQKDLNTGEKSLK